MATKQEALDEGTLWESARAGDPDALAMVFDLHRDRVFRHAMRWARSVADAEDITAMVFFELWRKRSVVRVVNGSVIAWLLVCTNNVARNTLRSERRYRSMLAALPSPDIQPDHSESVGDKIDASSRNNVVLAAFDSLSVRDRDVLTLCVLEEVSVADASTALRMSLATVKSRLARAKKRLAAAIADSDYVEGKMT